MASTTAGQNSATIGNNLVIAGATTILIRVKAATETENDGKETAVTTGDSGGEIGTSKSPVTELRSVTSEALDPIPHQRVSRLSLVDVESLR